MKITKEGVSTFYCELSFRTGKLLKNLENVARS
jgi:hypothetical protein